MEVTRGSEFTRDSIVGDLTFTVTGLSNHRLILRTSEQMSPIVDSGINLSDTEDTFRVFRGGAVEMATPTMDAGTRFEITYAD